MKVQEAIDLAAATGLRHGDLVRLPWSVIGDHAIVRHTGKSRAHTMVKVPILPETKAILARIYVRYTADMAAKRPDRRKPLPDTMLSNSYWRP